MPWRPDGLAQELQRLGDHGAQAAPASASGPRWREKSSTWWMILVMRVDLAPDDARVLGATSRRPLDARRSCASARARPPITFSGVPDLVRDLGRHLADGRQLLGLAQPRLQRQTGLRAALGLLARLAQRAGHGVEAAGQRADLVVALGQDARATDRPCRRRRCLPAAGAAARHHRLRSANQHPDARRTTTTRRNSGNMRRAGRGHRRRRCNARRAASPASPSGWRAGWRARQRQPGRVVAAAPPWRTSGRARRRVEQPPDGRVLNLGRLQQQQPRRIVVVLPGRSPTLQDLQLERSSRSRARQARRSGCASRVAVVGDRLDAARSASATSRAWRSRSASRSARRTFSAA